MYVSLSPRNASNSRGLTLLQGFLSKSWHVKSRGMFAGSCIGVVLLVFCLEFLRRMGREYDAFILRRARMRQTYLSGSSSGIPGSLLPKKIKRQGKCTGAEGDSKTPMVNKSYSQPESPDDLITPAIATTPEYVDGKPMARKDAMIATANDQATQRIDIDSAALPPYRPSVTEQVVRAFLHLVQFAVAYFVMLLAMYYNGYIIICIFIGAFVGSLIFSWEPISLSKE